MRVGLRVIAGSFSILVMATVLGLTANAFRKDGLPLIRKPLDQTRKVAKRADLITQTPADLKEPYVSPKPAALAAKKLRPDANSLDGRVDESNTDIVVSKPAAALLHAAPKTVGLTQQTKTTFKATVQKKKIQALFTTLKDAKTCFDGKNAIFLDARAVEDFDAEHIAGALWLGYESLDENYDKVLAETPKDKLLIAYCSDQQCASAIKLADALVARGHTRVVILLEGLPGWKGAGYPVESVKEAEN